MPRLYPTNIQNDVSGKAVKGDAVKSISRSGTTFTATKADNSTFTFTQQDNNTTYGAGSGITLSGNTFSNKYARTVLYDNGTGTNGTVSLSSSAANFNHMCIYYRTNDSDRCMSADIYSPNGKGIILMGGVASQNGANMKIKKATISGTSITSNYCYECYFAGSSYTSFNCIYIVRVEGWNE